MALTWWWVAVLGLVVLAAGYLWWRRSSATSAAAPAVLAHSERITATGRFAQLVARASRWTLIQMLCLGVILVGCLLGMGRLSWASQAPTEQNNRDIILCLDVSSSMTQVDVAVLKSYLDLAAGLKGERIGLVIWNGFAVTRFPLTTDYEVVSAELKTGYDVLTQNRAEDSWWYAPTLGDFGSSLIGDGLWSCLDRFDRPEEHRSRSIILATDNEPDGNSLYSVAEAAERATKAGVAVYALIPEKTPETDELTKLLAPTGGKTSVVSSPDAVPALIQAITAQEAARFKGSPQLVTHDLLWVSGSIMGVGLVGLMVANDRARADSGGRLRRFRRKGGGVRR